MIDQLDFRKLDGLLPAIVQDNTTRQVLMLGFMNREAIELTLREGVVTFWSRSKGRLWRKGESSGNSLRLVSMARDCDGDALLLLVDPAGPTCHTGRVSCFGDSAAPDIAGVMARLESVIAGRRDDPAESSYTAGLFRSGLPRIAQKVGEEGVEVVIAALREDAAALKEESADLLYHLMVLLAERGLSLGDVAGILAKRMK